MGSGQEGLDGQERQDPAAWLSRLSCLSCLSRPLYNQSFAVSQTTVRRRRKAMAGGKSELRRAVRRVTPGQGDLKD
jgi:hypothetical protein